MTVPSNLQEVLDEKLRKKQNAAYDAADSTPANPKSTAGAGQGTRGVPKGMAKGGSASSRADGCAERGKTKGTMIMCGGGMTRGKK